MVAIHSNSKCLNTSSLKMILAGAFPNMLTIVCCEGVDQTAMRPSGQSGTELADARSRYVVVVTANDTGLEGFRPKNDRSVQPKSEPYGATHNAAISSDQLRQQLTQSRPRDLSGLSP